MKISNDMLDEQFLMEIGSRIRKRRLSKNISQKQLADESGVGLRSIQRLESGQASSQLTTLFRVCRTLGLLESIDRAIPPPARSPIDAIGGKSSERLRAYPVSTKSEEHKPWTWGSSYDS